MEMCYDGTLVMPSSYAVMSEDEMTYVEGGYTVTKNLTGIHLRMSGTETAQFLSDASWATVTLCSVLGAAQPVAGAVVGAVCGIYGLMISRMNANNSGVTFHWNWPSIVTLNPIPGVTDNY